MAEVVCELSLRPTLTLHSSRAGRGLNSRQVRVPAYTPSVSYGQVYSGEGSGGGAFRCSPPYCIVSGMSILEYILLQYARVHSYSCRILLLHRQLEGHWILKWTTELSRL